MGSVFDHGDAWWDNDRDGHVRFMSVLFAPTAAHMTLVDFAANGVFDRHPELRVAVAELSADWFLQLPARVDGLYGMWEAIKGVPLNPSLDRTPGEYLHDHVLVVCSFPSDVTPELVQAMDTLPRTFAFATDHPHPEGLSRLQEYRSLTPGTVPGEHEANFFGGNIGALYAA
jgi:hypothetical protein